MRSAVIWYRAVCTGRVAQSKLRRTTHKPSAETQVVFFLTAVLFRIRLSRLLAYLADSFSDLASKSALAL